MARQPNLVGWGRGDGRTFFGSAHPHVTAAVVVLHIFSDVVAKEHGGETREFRRVIRVTERTIAHDEIDYRQLAKAAKLVVDTRKACRIAGVSSPNVVNA